MEFNAKPRGFSQDLPATMANRPLKLGIDGACFLAQIDA
jgi:hypothetical protein